MMKRNIDAVDGNYTGTRLVTIVDSIVFFVYMAVLVGRLFISESFYYSLPKAGDVDGVGLPGFGGPGYMFSFDMLLLMVSGLWLSVRFWRGGFIWQKTSLVVPLVLMLAGFIVSVSIASNRYSAFIDGLNLLSGLSACVIMVELLRERYRRRLLLTVVIALGCCELYRCYEQKYQEHPLTVEQMESDYAGFMAGRGLEAESWQARQLQERVLSMDTGGYFSISNTAASYFILTLAGGLCLFAGVSGEGARRRQEQVVAGIVLAASLAGIYITESTGGLASTAAIAAMLVFMLVFRGVLSRKVMYAGGVFLAIAGVAVVVVYGMVHDRLPTSSMWIRWQYWQATVQMICDNWLTGVGGQNFGIHYLYYMNPASPEAVKDPHCVPLAIFSQFGIFAFVGMLWGILAVGYRLLVRSGQVEVCDCDREFTGGISVRQLAGWVAGLVLVIFGANYFSIDDTFGELSGLVFGWIVGSRAILFGLVMMTAGYILLCKGWYSNLAEKGGGLLVITAVLLGFALHNSIDFAFFSPGVGLMFFYLTALAISIGNGRSGGVDIEYSNIRFGKVVGVLVLAGMVVTWAVAGGMVYQGESLLAKAAGRTVEGSRSRQLAVLESAVGIAAESSVENPLSAAGYDYAGELSGQLWQIGGYNEERYFNDAIHYLMKAGNLDRSNPEYSRRIGELYFEKSAREVKGAEGYRGGLDMASQYYEMHLSMYPGNADIMAKLAEVKFNQGDIEQAAELAGKSMAIEEAFMEMQPKLFPGREEYYPRMDIKLQKRMQEICEKVVNNGG